MKRWYSQWEKSKTRELPHIDEVYQHLMARIPPQQGASIVHGDYRLDNCMVSADGRIAAVLDWEICTLGDPLADLGLLMVYWTGPDDWEGGLATSATAVEGFPNRADLLERYTKTSGRDASRHRLLHLVRVLEAGLHRRGRLRAVPAPARWAPGREGFEVFKVQVERSRRERGGDRAAGVVSDRRRGSALRRSTVVPTLDSPVLVVALEGWIDAGLGAAAAAQALVADLHPTVDRDVRRRPAARLPRTTPGDAPPRRREHRRSRGPASSSTPRRTTRAATCCCSSGTSPTRCGSCSPSRSSRSRVEFGTRLVVGLGAYPFAAPHTRPSRLSTTANSTELAERLGYLRNSVDVPAGVEAAIERRCAEIGLPAVGLWAQVPHYAAAMPYPPASIALIDGLGQAAGLSLRVGLAEAGSLRARRPSRRAGLAERRAPRDVATARSTGRRRVGGVGRTHARSLRSTRATC